MEIFILIVVFAALVGGTIGWLCRGRVPLTTATCALTALTGQAAIILWGEPPNAEFSLHDLIGYVIYMGGPFVLFYLLPCVVAGLTTSFFVRKFCKHR